MHVSVHVMDLGTPPFTKPLPRNLLTFSFKDAVATIRRTGVEHQYQLVVTRAYEEGEEQLLEEDAESESPFLDMRVRTFQAPARLISTDLFSRR